jgi:hypothetical protein
MTNPVVNVWFSDGVEYCDYRLPDGRIVTRASRPTLNGAELGLSEVDLNNLIEEGQ